MMSAMAAMVERMARPWVDERGPDPSDAEPARRAADPGTGNVAFDDWRRSELAELDRRRAELDRTRDEFDAHAADLRRAKDREEFEAFMDRGRSRSGSDGEKGAGA